MKLATKQVEQARVQARAVAKQKVIELISQQIRPRYLYPRILDSLRVFRR